MNKTPGMTSFIGAGPGDPELLTIKGAKAIAGAALIIYAGSLLPREILIGARADAVIRDSAGMTLGETDALIKSFARAGEPVARLHSGDPSLYGAAAEQIALLEEENLPWEIIPGVTAACAAAAAAGIGFTKPEISQTLVITRLAGRTPMPADETPAALAAPHRSLAVYLAGAKAGELRAELLKSLPPDTPVLCAHKVGQPGVKLVWTDIDDMEKRVVENGLRDQTIFLILPGHNKKGANSRLYDKKFGHRFREGSKGE